MKFIGIIFFVMSAGQLNAQRTDFVDYLLELQNIADPIREHMIDVLDTAKASLNAQLIELNLKGLQEITEGLQTVIAIRETIEDLIANQSTSDNEECINEATSTWPENLETTGDDIAACSEEHVYTIFHEIQVFHTYIEEQNKAAFNVYNLVLNLFDNLNPLTSAGEITPAINAQIDEINNEFEGTIRPEIERHLTFISNMRLSIPGEIHRCVDTAVSRLNNESIDVYHAVDAC